MFDKLDDGDPAADTDQQAKDLANHLLGKSEHDDELEAAESGSLFEAAFEATSICKLLIRPQGNVFNVFVANQAMCDFLGYTKAELRQLSLREISHSEDMALDLVELSKLLAGEIDRYQLDKRYIHKSGRLVWGQLHVAAIRQPNGTLEYVLSEIQDITLRKEYEAAWQREQERLRQAEALAHLGTWEVDLSTGQAVWSDETFRICGLDPAIATPDSFIGSERLHPDDREATERMMRASLAGQGAYHTEFRVLRPDGEVRHVISQARLLPAEAEWPQRLTGYVLDITAMKEQGELLQRSNRLLAAQNAHLEQLAHLASHNLRSPLANIQALANLYAMSSLSERQEHVKLIQESARRAMETLTEMFERLRQTKRLEHEKRRVSFAPIAQRVLQILESEKRRAQAEITLDFAACPELDYIPLYLESILLNLLSNALKYTVPGRPVQIRVRSWQENQSSWLEVADNGSGIDLERHGQQLFGLYQAFSGRDDSQGVGLYLVKTQIEASGGSISVESEPNIGTTFKIRF